MLKNIFRNWQGDLSGGLTAAFTGLPLALAFGIASGAGPIAGIYGTICCGLFASLFGGAPTQISGPNSAMTALMTVIIARFSHNPALAFTVVMMAGIFQIALGYLKIGRFLSFIPKPVIAGFMGGVGLYIILMQLGRVMGHKTQIDPISNLLALPTFLQTPVMDAVVITAIALLIVISTPKLVSQFIPSSILALIVCTFLAVFTLTGAPHVPHMPTALPHFYWPTFEFSSLFEMLKGAVALAAVSSTYSLLAAIMADEKLETRHQPNKELIGQGIGNLFTGFIGGLAGTGAPVRTMINVQAGGRTQLSGIICALAMLSIVLALSDFASYIPQAMLAGILIKAGYDIIDWQYLKNIKSLMPFERLLFVGTIIITLVFDLVTAMFFGAIASSFWAMTRIEQDFCAHTTSTRTPHSPSLWPQEAQNLIANLPHAPTLVHLEGTLCYAVSHSFEAVLQQYQALHTVILDMGGVRIMDSTTVTTLKRWLQIRHKHGFQTVIVHPNEDIVKLLSASSTLQLIAQGGIQQDIINACRVIAQWSKGQQAA